MNVTEAALAAFLVLVVLVLGYRLLRREPLTRVVRFGVFIERRRFDPDDGQVETQEWPRRRDDS